MLPVFRVLFVIILFLADYIVVAQYLDINSGMNISNIEGDEIYAEWSPDGKKLLFQSTKNDKSDIYIYHMDNDTTLVFNNPSINFRNPIWHPNGEQIVFDSDLNGIDYLYTLNIKSHKFEPLFSRKISCKNATFSSSSRQVYFIGFNEIDNCWDIYSYDFIYDNLNQLSNNKVEEKDIDIDNSGKTLIFSQVDSYLDKSNLAVINWYGEAISGLKNITGETPSWGANGLKIFFVSDRDCSKNELFSIWKDGSHLEKITNYEVGVCSPVVSPDGTKLAMSIKTEKGWDVFVFPFEDY